MALADLMHFCLHVQTTTSLEQAFLKGYLMATGGEKALIKSVEALQWELMKKDPERWISIEQDTIRIALEVAKQQHDEASKLGEEHGISLGGK